MFLLTFFCWLCLFNSFLAYPLSDLADYPDLTRGLTDAEVKACMQGFKLDDLKNVDYLILGQIAEREEENKANLRAQSKKNFRAAGNSCREENESDEPKPISRCKPHVQSCATTKRCMQTTTTTTTCAPKTTRTTKPDCVPKSSCAPKTTSCAPKTTTCAPKTTSCGSSMDIFAKCPKLDRLNRRKKSRIDNEWESDYFQDQAGKRREKGKNTFQQLDLPEDDALAKYTLARDLAQIEKSGGEIVPPLNDQGEPLDEAFHLDYPKESIRMEPAQLHDDPGKRKLEPLANLEQGHHASFEDHQFHSDHKLQHAANFNRKHEVNFGREQEVNFGREQEINLKQTPEAKGQQEMFDNFNQDDLWANADPANWVDTEQTDSDRMKLATWASLDPANLANIEDANWDLSKWGCGEQSHQPLVQVQEHNNFELEKPAKFQPAQEQQATFQLGNQNHNFKRDNQAKMEQGNQPISEHGSRANLQLQNQDNYEQTHRQVRDYQQADLNRNQPRHQDREMRSEVNLHPSGHQLQNQDSFEQTHRNRQVRDYQQADLNRDQPRHQQGNQGISEHGNRANLQLQNQDNFELIETHRSRQVRNYQQADLNRDHHQERELRSEVNLHPSGHQLQNQDSFEQTHRQVRDYQQADLNHDHHQDRELRSEQERQAFIAHREQQSDVNYHPRRWTSNQPLTNQEKLNTVEGEPTPLQQISRKRNAEQESQASMPQGGTYREQRSEVKYHQRPQQWPSNQPLTNQAKLDTMEGEGHVVYKKKRKAKVERSCGKRRFAGKNKEQLVTKNNEPQPVNADLTMQGSHYDVDRFLAKNARDPPRYLSSMQNDRIQRENERRLSKDRSLSESLNLDRLTGKKVVASPAGESEWAAADNKRGKRENGSTDDAPENSSETYLKKLMESFPRDQGSQINANAALRDCPFKHERMKRS